MKILNQFDPLVVEDIKEVLYTCAHHSHTYYELVYIHSGNGIHYLNEDVIPYYEGDLFLIAPGEHHYFEIKELSHFTYVKFTEGYFESKKHLAPDDFKVGSPEILMEMKWLKEVKICLEKPFRDILKSAIVNLVNYNDYYGNINSSSVVYYQLLSIFGIVKEILKERNVADHTGELNIEKLTSFIHENIYDRDKLAVKLISENFNISPTYFSNYFRRHFNISYQEYLNNYRVTLIEKRLNIEGLKLKQIVEEFGFTDTSHLSKTFKKIKGVTPQNYLKSVGKNTNKIN